MSRARPIPSLPFARGTAWPSPPQHAGMRGHVHVPPIRARPWQGRGVELDGNGTRRWKGRRLTSRGSMRVDMGEGEGRTVSGAAGVCECVISQPLQVGQLLVGFLSACELDSRSLADRHRPSTLGNKGLVQRVPANTPVFCREIYSHRSM